MSSGTNSEGLVIRGSEAVRMPEAAEDRPAVSIIVPAWNEEALLPGTLRAIAAAATAVGVPHEVIVVDDASTDRTATIAAEHGARVVHVCQRRIARVRNAGAAAARGGLLVFVDADTTLTAGLLRGALDAVARGAVGGGAPAFFDGTLPLYGRLFAPTGIVVQRVFRVAFGCFLFCTRAAFDAVGGFDGTLYAGEEIFMSLALKRQGSFRILRERVQTSGRKVRSCSQREIVALFWQAAVGGRSFLRSPKNKEIWYGPRGKTAHHGMAATRRKNAGTG